MAASKNNCRFWRRQLASFLILVLTSVKGWKSGTGMSHIYKLSNNSVSSNRFKALKKQLKLSTLHSNVLQRSMIQRLSLISLKLFSVYENTKSLVRQEPPKPLHSGMWNAMPSKARCFGERKNCPQWW
jgi:hypothetical protein